MLSVVCWKWKPPAGYRSAFGPETVNILRQMVKRHYPRRHRFICVTDDPRGLDPGIKVIPLWDEHAGLLNPFGPSNPSCYRRLRMFSREAAELFGERFVSIDLDCVITGDLSRLWNRAEDFVAWGDTNPTTHYNGSMMMLRAGSRPQVWEDFDPIASPRQARAAGQFGSDQAWISHRLGPREAKWTTADGVYSYRVHMVRTRRYELPTAARVVFFHGNTDPWSPSAQRLPWIKEHYAYTRRGKGMVHVQSINIGRRLALLTTGQTLPITTLFDAEGDTTEDPAEAVAFAAGQGGMWFSGAVAHYAQATSQ